MEISAQAKQAVPSRPEDGNAIAAELERRRIRKRYYLETRSDVLLRNLKVFQRWTRLGLAYMFLGMEAIDAKELECSASE
jgi:hopanoid C-3 methylase